MRWVYWKHHLFRGGRGQYIWYTVSVVTDYPATLKTVNLTTEIRKALIYELDIENDLSESVNYEVIIAGAGLVGQPFFELKGKSKGKYSLVSSIQSWPQEVASASSIHGSGRCFMNSTYFVRRGQWLGYTNSFAIGCSETSFVGTGEPVAERSHTHHLTTATQKYLKRQSTPCDSKQVRNENSKCCIPQPALTPLRRLISASPAGHRRLVVEYPRNGGYHLFQRTRW